MLDQVLGSSDPAFAQPGWRLGASRSSHGSAAACVTWGLEAVMLTAGTCVEWLRDDLGLVDVGRGDRRARRVGRRRRRRVRSSLRSSGSARPSGTSVRAGGSSGSRGARRGRTSSARSSRASPSAAATWSSPPSTDGRAPLEALRVDGGMSANATFVQLLADVTGRRVEVAPVLEATTRGAGLLACLGTGARGRGRRPGGDVAPLARRGARSTTRHAAPRRGRTGCAPRRQALRTIPSLSGVSFV